MLGVTRASTDVEIKSAYRKLAMTYHPDRNPNNPEAEDKFKEITEAYAILADSEKRSVYDRFGHAGLGGGGAPSGFDPAIFQDFGDIFGDIFGLATRSDKADAAAAVLSVERIFARTCLLISRKRYLAPRSR